MSILIVIGRILFIVFFFMRKKWIEKPLVHFLAGLLLSK